MSDPIAEYSDSLRQHIVYVQEAGRQIGVSEYLLKEHDASKWHMNEFDAYSEYFHNGKKNRTEFARAWLHHIHNNPHHWEHWIFSDPGYNFAGAEIVNRCIEMPKMYALEMVADWMGASRSYTGSWDMTEWLMKNASRIIVHPKTNQYLCDVLLNNGYQDLVCVYQLGFGSKNVWERHEEIKE
jgi:hypothetical protein